MNEQIEIKFLRDKVELLQKQLRKCILQRNAFITSSYVEGENPFETIVVMNDELEALHDPTKMWSLPFKDC